MYEIRRLQRGEEPEYIGRADTLDAARQRIVAELTKAGFFQIVETEPGAEADRAAAGADTDGVRRTIYPRIEVRLPTCETQGREGQSPAGEGAPPGS